MWIFLVLAIDMGRYTDFVALIYLYHCAAGRVGKRGDFPYFLVHGGDNFRALRQREMSYYLYIYRR